MYGRIISGADRNTYAQMIVVCPADTTSKTTWKPTIQSPHVRSTAASTPVRRSLARTKRAKSACRYCGESRYDRRGKSRRTYTYFPIIPRLEQQFADKDLKSMSKPSLRIAPSFSTAAPGSGGPRKPCSTR